MTAVLLFQVFTYGCSSIEFL